MDKQIRVISVFCVFLVVILMISTTLMQFVNADELTKSGYNTRSIYEEYGRNRGDILVNSANGEKVIAYSAKADDSFKYQRIYNDPDIYAPITGFFSIANHTDRGIESALNDALNGNIPSLSMNNFTNLLLGKEQRGANVHLTIDDSLQTLSYQALKNSGNNGAVVAIDPRNGELLALASYPTVDYNSFAVHSTAKASQAYNNAAADTASPMTNRATDEVYPPGSTFKLIDMAMLLESGDYSASSVVEAPLRWTLPGTTTDLPNYGGSSCGAVDGKESLQTALARSCNTPFAILGTSLGNAKLYNMANKFGFGKTYNIVSGEVLSSTTDNAYSVSNTSKGISAASSFPKEQKDDRLAMAAIGQGDVTITPLQDCLISAIITNRGKSVIPKIVASITDSDNKPISDIMSSITHGITNTLSNNLSNSDEDRVISDKSASELSDMMTYNVSNGVASGAAVKGFKVAGKTGTAENDPDLPSHSWFTGFAPADNPRIAICVFLQNGDNRAGGAAKIAGNILNKYLNGVDN